MVDHFEIRHTSPSIAFLFARLRGLLDSSSDPLGVRFPCSSDQYPQIRDFVVGHSGLGLALGDLYPLLHQSLSWFKSVCGVFRRENMGSEVRSGGPERGSSSNVIVEGGWDRHSQLRAYLHTFIFHPSCFCRSLFFSCPQGELYLEGRCL